MTPSLVELDSMPFANMHNVLNRMRRAHEKGRGVRISADELHTMSVTLFGQVWSEEDPLSRSLTDEER